MRRLFVIVPDRHSCERIVEELEERGVPEEHLHVIAALTEATEGLPKATMWQTTEVLDGVLWGTGLGSAAGFLGALLLASFPPPGMHPGAGTAAVLVAVGALLGAAVAAMISSEEHNHALDGFADAIAQGRLLLMVDVARHEVDGVRSVIRSHHPEARVVVARRRR